MGYFDGLVEASFKKDTNGNAVFHPWGIFGRGRVLADPAKAAELRAFVRLYYQVSLPLIIVLAVVGVWWLLLVAAIALPLWFVLRSRYLLTGAPFSEERLTWKQSVQNSANAHNRFILWFLCLSSGCFVAITLWLAIVRAHSMKQVLILGAGAALFGLCTAIIGYMIKVRRA